MDISVLQIVSFRHRLVFAWVSVNKTINNQDIATEQVNFSNISTSYQLAIFQPLSLYLLFLQSLHLSEGAYKLVKAIATKRNLIRVLHYSEKYQTRDYKHCPMQ